MENLLACQIDALVDPNNNRGEYHSFCGGKKMNDTIIKVVIILIAALFILVWYVSNSQENEGKHD